MTRRLLIIGCVRQSLRCLEWDDWQSENLLDYQGVVLDYRSCSGAISNRGVLLARISELLTNSHPVFVILPDHDTQDGQYLPNSHLGIIKTRGRTLNPTGSAAPIFANYLKALRGHEIVVTAARTPQNWPWIPAIVNNVNQVVCAQFYHAFVLHPPAKELEEAAWTAIYGSFNPEFEDRGKPTPPDWAADAISQIPGLKEVEAQIAGLVARIASLQRELEQAQARRDSLEEWASILWLDGIPLQDMVERVMKAFGFKTEAKDPTGHTHDFSAAHDASTFLVEVTGSVAAIGLDKGRQLVEWVLRSDSPTKVHGILLGNAFRKEPPGNRPPTPNHRIFVTELEDLARHMHFGLLDTRELLRAFVATLEGKTISIESICQDLHADGVIKFGLT